MKKTLFKVAVIAVVIGALMVSCKKEQEIALSGSGQTVPNVPQGQDAITRIVNFRNQLETYKKNPSTRIIETVSLTDALWYIENLFNVTYAMPEEFYSETDVFEVDLMMPVDTAGRVALMDLFETYNHLVSAARTAYANDVFINKGFAYLLVKVEEQYEDYVRLVIRGKTGERTTHPNIHPHDSAMFFGPFDTTDYWQYADGMGKCDNTCLWSGADKEIQRYLENYLRITLSTPEAGARAVYLNPITITLDGSNKPNDVFYRHDVDATCIDFNNMNRLYQREKRLIFETIPNDMSFHVYGFTPMGIEIDGQNVNEAYITHKNELTYAQRIMASIDAIGETQDLLDDQNCEP